ncbi:Phage head-tail joining protein [Aquimixticola soesokkakensis]|uniref:Phage head-tail joining protein n=1 Tax=Aquimixticola soesokkakensis TaxID=1519096 RepID=A0A1Y5SCP3_9RHOB|nr:phage head closure protein [Aquimixticola soesokkakensis]SLN36604.1 Phage head-tail joining protein [Aquimixticola soesokkakensis]
MTAGRMRDRVAFERQSKGEDEYGNPAQDWAPMFTVWADVLETRGREKVAAGVIEASNTATVRIRTSTQARTIAAADRAIFRGAAWNIISPPIELGRDRSLLELLCERGVAN